MEGGFVYGRRLAHGYWEAEIVTLSTLTAHHEETALTLLLRLELELVAGERSGHRGRGARAEELIVSFLGEICGETRLREGLLEVEC